MFIVDKNMPVEQQTDKYILTPSERFGIYDILFTVTSGDYDKMLSWLDRDIKELFKLVMYMKIRSQTENI